MSKKEKKVYAVYLKKPVFLDQMSRFKHLTATTKRVYALIYTSILQSQKTVFVDKNKAYIDDDGQVFCYLKMERIKQKLGISLGKASSAKKDLAQVGLIRVVDKRIGYKTVSKIYLTDLKTLGIPDDLLYIGTAGGYKLSKKAKGSSKEKRFVYATYQRLPLFIGSDLRFAKYTKRGWDIYTYLYDQITTSEEKLADNGVTAHVDEAGNCFVETALKSDLANRLNMDVKTARNYISNLVSDKLIKVASVNGRFRYYLCNLNSLALDKSLTYTGSFLYDQKGKNESRSSKIPDHAQSDNSNGSSNSIAPHLNAPYVHSSIKSKESSSDLTNKKSKGKNVAKLNQSNSVIFPIDIDNKKSTLLNSIVQKLISSGVNLKYLKVKDATQGQIRVANNQLTTLNSLIGKVSKAFVNAKVNFIINYQNLKSDAINYLIKTIENELKRKKIKRELNQEKQHRWNKAHTSYKGRTKRFATELDRKLAEAKTPAEEQEIMTKYYDNVAKKINSKNENEQAKPDNEINVFSVDQLKNVDWDNLDMPF